ESSNLRFQERSMPMRHPVRWESQSQEPSPDSSDRTFACNRLLGGSGLCLFRPRVQFAPPGYVPKESWRSGFRQSPDARRCSQATISLAPVNDRGGLVAPIQRRISIRNVVHLDMRVIHELWSAFRHLTLQRRIARIDTQHEKVSGSK